MTNSRKSESLVLEGLGSSSPPHLTLSHVCLFDVVFCVLPLGLVFHFVFVVWVVVLVVVPACQQNGCFVAIPELRFPL